MRSDKSDKSDKGDFGSHHVYYFESRLTSNEDEDDSQHTTWNDFVVPASLVVICSTSLAKLGASWLSKACSITTLLQVPQLEMGPSINVPSRARHTNNRQLTAIGAENDPPGHQLGPFVSEFSQNTLTRISDEASMKYGIWLKLQLASCFLFYFIWIGVGLIDQLSSSIHRPDFSRGRDHLFFLDQGLPAVRFTEPYENFAH